ncbi:MAG: glycoside hydrolase family 15 protein [Gammaproteobacteria bacterium]|jgi:GH15 family glucan-1,4-alpha-glucosidase
MPLAIEDYALIGNTRTAALVGRDGSIDWLCVPRFDSAACFAALLGDPSHGRWLLAPRGRVSAVRRRYRQGTLVLETEFETEGGAVRIIDCMPHWNDRCELVRLVQGVRGSVSMRSELVIRFDYGTVTPWVRSTDSGVLATAGPDSLQFRSLVPLRGEDFTTIAEFRVEHGHTLPFVLTHFPSHQAPPLPIDPHAACEETASWWRGWSGASSYDGLYAEAVERSLVTLKALTYAPTGGIVAAPTTSLPECLGGQRNWDYRYCWLRDATFTLYALLIAGYTDEARAWREWLLRAAAGAPQDLQILYGLAGERRLSEVELPWLPGYQGARPARAGNAAFSQRQLDVYGEVFDALHLARRSALQPTPHSWDLQRVLLDFLESAWSEPDDGIWEMRGPRRHFTHSKVMAWVAFDRAIKAVDNFGLEGPRSRWQTLRDSIHEQVCRRGFDRQRGTFVQHYGSSSLDASLLMLPLVGFLPADDERVRGTVAAIERELTADHGLVLRYRSDQGAEDGLPPGEGVFLPCSFWLVDNLAMAGRTEEARALFERLLDLRNDVGLLSEEYDPQARRLLGNFPQAFTHIALINSARNLTRSGGPSEHRARDEHHPGAPT